MNFVILSKLKLVKKSHSIQNKEMTSEARMMRAFQHKNVVKLYGLVAETSPVTLVVEFMSGGDLARALRKRKIPPQYRIQLALHAALGIEHIHEK